MWFILAQHQAFSQFGYPLGLNPSATKWYQINTDSFQLIFPENTLPKGQRVANLVAELYGLDQTIGNSKRKVSIVLHPKTVTPNGFVALAPFRSELFLTPPQASFLGNGDWLDLLTIHEYRHVQQNVNARKGATKWASWVFGQNGWALMRQIAIPRWFMEGDAVLYETMLSPAGRGRVPAFDMEYRALLLQNRTYSYEKASAGSFKNFVPDHYKLGYYLSAQARKEYGADVWKDVVNASGRYKGILFPFSRNLKKNTGLRTPQLYSTTIAQLKQQWENDEKTAQYTDFRSVKSLPQKGFTSYEYPQFVSDSGAIVLKSGFDLIPALYKIDLHGNQEEKITLPGFQVDANRSYSEKNGQLYWTEMRFDKRWANQNFSDIYYYNLFNKKKKRITTKGKYFSVAVSNDGVKLLSVKVPESGDPQLVVLNSFNGEELITLPNAEGYFYAHPTWLSESRAVVVAQKDHKQALFSVNLTSGQHETIVPFASRQITFPVVSPDGKWVIYSSTETGINNLFATNLSTKETYQVTSDRFGAFYPSVSPSGQKLLYSAYTNNGFELKEIPFAPEKWEKAKANTKSSITFYEPLLKQADQPITDLPNQEYDVKRYHEVSQLINFHSIRTLPLHPNYLAEVQSDNVFSTLSARVGLNYNVNDRNTIYYADVSYGRYFPVIEAGAQAGTERDMTIYFLNEKITSNSQTNVSDTSYIPTPVTRTWAEKLYYGGVSLPFNLSGGASYGSLTVSGHLQRIQTTYEPDLFIPNGATKTSTAYDFKVLFARTQLQAKRHIYPRLGVTFVLRKRKTISGLEADQLYTNTQVFLPGIFKNHSVWGGFSTNTEKTSNPYLFSNNFFYSRGYTGIRSDQLQKYSFNYAFPLLYPDIAIGPFFFLQRIKANVFYDQTTATNNFFNVPGINLENPQEILGYGAISLRDFSLRSYGVEVTFDFRFMRLLDMDLGIRWSRLSDGAFTGQQANQFEIVINSLGF